MTNVIDQIDFEGEFQISPEKVKKMVYWIFGIPITILLIGSFFMFYFLNFAPILGLSLIIPCIILAIRAKTMYNYFIAYRFGIDEKSIYHYFKTAEDGFLSTMQIRNKHYATVDTPKRILISRITTRRNKLNFYGFHGKAFDGQNYKNYVVLFKNISNSNEIMNYIMSKSKLK